jgi:molybdopterin-guanine dinucleotide biosynthesis protein B
MLDPGPLPMKVVGFSGYSGSGKTTLVEKLVVEFVRRGLRVSVVKHAHHSFDIDHEGKDSWRHRRAGAREVVIASGHRLAKIREFSEWVEPTVHDLLAELGHCDWALVEGFKRSAIPKVEVWRAEAGHIVRYPDDPHIIAVATDSPSLPVATTLPVLDLNDACAVADFLLADCGRYAYSAPTP